MSLTKGGGVYGPIRGSKVPPKKEEVKKHKKISKFNAKEKIKQCKKNRINMKSVMLKLKLANNLNKIKHTNLSDIRDEILRHERLSNAYTITRE